MIRALVVAITLSLLLASPAAAQGPATGIQATGLGTASAPAKTAHLQILLSSSAAFGMGPSEFVPGTPSPVDASREQLGPVIEVIAASGVAQDAIVVGQSANNNFFGPGGPEITEIRVAFDQPQGDNLASLVEALPAAAREVGMSVLHVGVRYEATNCESLLQQAREAAIADANQRAEGLAQGLGVRLGALTLASEMPYYGPSGSESCAPAGTAGDFGPYGPGTEPTFDPDVTEATVFVQVTLTYAIEPSA